MSKYNFVHLHNHTEYSLLDGMIRVESLVEKAKELKMNAVALTDHGNMHGAIEFYKACEKHNIKPIIGQEFYMTPFSRHEKKGPRYHLVLLAKSEIGYKNLLKLSSISFIEGFYYKPRIDRELLEKYSEGLICLSGCLQGEIPTLILEQKLQEAEKTALYFKELFGSNSFFLEIQIHGLKDEINTAKSLFSMSKKLQIPLTATNDAHYLNKEDSEAHDILLCIGTKKSLHEQSRMRFYGEEFYFKNEEEMEIIFKEVPKALTNTQFIAEICDLKINLPGPQLPEFDVPEGYTKETYLKEIALDGLKHKYNNTTPELIERLNHELEVINRTGFAGYFLIVWDFIHYAKKNDIWIGPGRGSGAGSIVAYSLNITDIDPIKYGLIFERFLNEKRISMPDFDIDFCKERRQEVIDYVSNKYSKDKVSQIVTFSKMNAKAVIRDVGRVLEIPLIRVNEIVKMLPEGKDLKKEILEEAALREIFEKGNEEEKKLLDISIKLEGLSRHTSMHAAGVVIGRLPIIEYVPLQLVKDEKNGDVIITQFPGPQLEECGLVKMDFLGLITLTLMRNCIELLAKRGIFLDIAKIDLEDQKVFDLFSRGDTDAIFQFESPGMKKFLKKLRPTCIEDLIAMNALYRPGPMNFIDTYIARKHGEEKIEYDHPFMEPILRETYGIIIYQEQVMKIAQILAGYDLGTADELRKAMGKKNLKVMKDHEKIFVDGCSKNGIQKGLAERIYNKMSDFAKYGFNKSHSAAYAYLAYQCAFLKTYYPAEFMASVLTSEIGKPDKLSDYINGIKELNLTILPPNVNHSGIVFTVEEGKIRYALSGIKGVGDAASLNIISVRDKEKQFKSLSHFLQTIDLRILNRAVLETLIKCGAFDCFGQKRKWCFENLDDMIDSAQLIQADRKIGQKHLFNIEEVEEKNMKKTSDSNQQEEWNITELLMLEKEVLGFYSSGHPLDRYFPFIRKHCNHSSKTIKKINLNSNNNHSSRISVTMAGIVDKFRVFTQDKGGNWAIVTLEDFDGKFDLFVYKKEYEEFKDLILKNKFVLIKGNCIENNKQERIVIAQAIKDLEKTKIETINEFHIYINNEQKANNDDLISLKNELSKMEGILSIFFHIRENDGETIIKSTNIRGPKDITACEELRNKYSFIEKIKIV